MRIAVLGASGKVGQQLTAILLARGHTVTAMVHTSALSLPPNPKLRTVTGDINNPADISELISGSDAVVCTLGSWGTKTKDIVSIATEHLIPAMQKANIQRFVSITGSAAKLPNEHLNLLQSLTRKLLGLIAKPILTDAEKHLRLLASSNLDWTAVRSPVMTNSTKTIYLLRIDPLGPRATVSRHAVALSLADLIENDSFIKQAPYISVK